MSRSDSRECGFKLIYQYLFNKDFDYDKFFESFSIDEFDKILSLSEDEKLFASSIFDNFKMHFEEVEQKIENALQKNLTLKDVYLVDRAIVSEAVVQIDFLNEPFGLVANEAVEIAKKYSTDKSPAFVNGLISSIYKK